MSWILYTFAARNCISGAPGFPAPDGVNASDRGVYGFLAAMDPLWLVVVTCSHQYQWYDAGFWWFLDFDNALYIYR